MQLSTPHAPSSSSSQLVDEGNKRVVTLEKSGFPDAVSYTLRGKALLADCPFSEGC